MKIAVLGTGMVGHTIADKLVSIGHDVRMGARQAQNEKAAAWSRALRARLRLGLIGIGLSNRRAGLHRVLSRRHALE